MRHIRYFLHLLMNHIGLSINFLNLPLDIMHLKYSPSLWDGLLSIGDIFEALLKDDLYHIRCYKKTIIFNGHEDLNTLCKVPTVQSE